VLASFVPPVRKRSAIQIKGPLITARRHRKQGLATGYPDADYPVTFAVSHSIGCMSSQVGVMARIGPRQYSPRRGTEPSRDPQLYPAWRAFTNLCGMHWGAQRRRSSRSPSGRRVDDVALPEVKRHVGDLYRRRRRRLAPVLVDGARALSALLRIFVAAV
jgi:hypothetical protein